MFETNLLEVGADRRRRLMPFAVGSIGLQVAVLAGFIVGPLVYPETLPVAPRRYEVKPVRLVKPRPEPAPTRPVVSVEADAGLHAPSAPAVLITRGGMISHAPADLNESAPALPVGGGMATTFTLATGPGGSANGGGGPVVSASKGDTGRTGSLRISSGVSAGLLLAPIRPEYPRIAVAAGVEGTVVVTATIDREGHIVGLQVVSGPVMLRDAAMNAVREARYRPFRLNGEATEVVTTISLNFRRNS